MKTCHSCGHKNFETGSFCSNCGASLNEGILKAASETDGERKRFNKRRLLLMLIFAGVLVFIFALFAGYRLTAKKYSEEAVIEQFVTALISKDKESVKELLKPTDSRLVVNNESLDALFALLDEEPSLIDDIKNSLQDEKLGANMFFLKKDGKRFGLFDKYTVDTKGYFITIDDPGVETTIFVNESEMGVLDGSQSSLEIGPLLAGSYEVKAVYEKDGKEEKETKAVKLSGTKVITEVALQIKPEKKEEANEKTVIKEVIREVPVKKKNNYYLLPHSGYAYVTYADIAGLSKRELRLARNEIYARHGYIFKSPDLQAYFNSQAWYTPDSSYNGSLSPVEQYNVNFIKSFE